MANVLVVIDIQKEYITPGRAFCLNGIEPSLENCRKVLAWARQQSWKIVHIQHFRAQADAVIFNAKSPYADFVEGFEPKSGELHITKHLYSCYSSPEFVALMQAHKDDQFYIIGYNSIMCCLSTAIEGYHRGHHWHLVEDATYAKATDEFSEADMHQHSMSIMRTAKYAKLLKTADLIN